MLVKSIADIRQTPRQVECPNGGFTSYRLLLAEDGLGFSLHRTVLPPGPPQRWHYKNHLEACYCTEGRGILTNVATGGKHSIHQGMLYALDGYEEHTLEVLEDMILICVFNPPIKGEEVHDEHGTYPRSD